MAALHLLLCAAMLAGSAHAQPGPPAAGFTPKEELSALFEVEGDTPFPSPYAGTLAFSALQSKYDSGHGHGYRNELKIAKKHRLAMGATNEQFSARVTATLAAGAKTIVAQYHAEGLDTLLKVYLQDTADRKALDGVAGNGMFDVLARIKGVDGKEVMTALGTVRSGESFDLDISLKNGEGMVAVKTASHGPVQTDRTRIQAGGGNIYFKFGDYLQALDPATLAHTTSRAKWDEYYQLNRIDASQVRFSRTRFHREQP